MYVLVTVGLLALNKQAGWYGLVELDDQLHRGNEV